MDTSPEPLESSHGLHEVFRLREALEVQASEIDALRRENCRLQAEGQELGKLRDTLDALREESGRLELQERQVAELHEDLVALRQENMRLQELSGDPELLQRSSVQLQDKAEEVAALREVMQQQAAELGRLQCENQRVQIQQRELTELREVLKLERIAASAQHYELMTLRNFLRERGIDVETLEAEDEALASECLPPRDLRAELSPAWRAGCSQALAAPAPGAPDAAPGSPGSRGLGGPGPRARTQAPTPPPTPPLPAPRPALGEAAAHSDATFQFQKQPLVAAADMSQHDCQPLPAFRERRILLDLGGHEQELSGVSEIPDETVSLDSVLVDRRRQSPREDELHEPHEASPEVPSTLTSALGRENGRPGERDEEIARLRQALELQTANVDTLLREGRRLQALEGQLADLRGVVPPGQQAPLPGLRAGADAQDASQRSGSLATEEAWSLTSTSETSPGGGLGLDSATMSSPSQQLTACDRDGLALPDAGGSCRRWPARDAEEPWRLVRAIIGMLDTMQQKLAAGAVDRAGLTSGEGWRSVASVDIRILVGVGPGAGEEAAEEAGRSFMYVLL